MTSHPRCHGLAAVSALIISSVFVACRTASAAVTLGDPVADDSPAAKSSQQTVVLAGGCFWGMQLLFEHVKLRTCHAKVVIGISGFRPQTGVSYASLVLDTTTLPAQHAQRAQ